MPFPPVPSSGPGGILVLEYQRTSTGDKHLLKLAVAQYDQTPSGPDNDHLYTGAGPVAPAENGVIATFHAIANLWKTYYTPDWAISVRELLWEQIGTRLVIPTVPTPSPVLGTAAEIPEAAYGQRIFTFGTNGGSMNRRLHFKQMQCDEFVELNVDVGASTGGIDSRDPPVVAYASGATGGGFVGFDGFRFSSEALVKLIGDRDPITAAGAGAVDAGGNLSTPCLTFLSHGAQICNPSPDLLTITSPNTYDFDATGITLPGGGRLEG